MKRTLKGICTAALAAGVCVGAAAASQAAWSGNSYLNECNISGDVPTGAVLVDSASDRAPDGTAYIKASETSTDWLNPDKTDMAFEAVFSNTPLEALCTWETDIKFTQTGAGFSIRNNSGNKAGNLDTTIALGSDNTLRYSSASGTRISTNSIDINKWYHVKLVGTYTGNGNTEGEVKLTISEYGENNTSTVVVDTVADRRQNYAPTRFVFTPGVCVDNVRAYEMPPAALALTGASNVTAGNTQQFSAQLYADAGKTLPMSGFNVVYELYNTEKTQYLISDAVTISPTGGLLTVSSSAESQSFVVRAKCVDLPEVYDDITVKVESVEMLEFLGAGFDDLDNPTRLVNLKFNQYYENEGDITFVAVVLDENGLITNAYTKNLAYRDQQTGEITVTINKALPQGFDKNKCKIKVFAWTKSLD